MITWTCKKSKSRKAAFPQNYSKLNENISAVEENVCMKQLSYEELVNIPDTNKNPFENDEALKFLCTQFIEHSCFYQAPNSKSWIKNFMSNNKIVYIHVRVWVVKRTSELSLITGDSKSWLAWISEKTYKI